MFRRRTLLGKKGTPVKEGCLMFTATSSGTFSFTKDGLSYSIDGLTWKTLAGNTPTPTIASGKKIWFKGTLTPSTLSPYGIGTFSSTGNFTVSGTPMSLLFGDDFEGKTSLSGKKYAFYGLFRSCTKLVSIDGLVLPATTLANSCYRNMFRDTGLASIPTGLLHATTLAVNCYNGMFQGCKGLTSIPSDLLPATTLATNCYYYMFSGCTNITTAPDLPATTLKTYCYYYMLKGCTKLNSIRMLATDISAQYCLTGWVSNVASSGTFYKKSGVTIPTGISGIPSGWTVVDE